MARVSTRWVSVTYVAVEIFFALDAQFLALGLVDSKISLWKRYSSVI